MIQSQKDKDADPRDLPPHARLFDWKRSGPYRWKEGFPLQPTLKPRQRLTGRGGAPGGAGGAGDAEEAVG